MLSFLLFISSISTTTESYYPVASLIDESNDQVWQKYKIDRTSWTATADSEQTTDQVNEGPISNILTGDPNKIWLTKINGNGNGGHDNRPSNKGPFRFTINLHRRTTFKAFSIMPRQNGDQGKMKLYEFYAAQNESELNTQIGSGQYLAKGTIDTTEIKSTLVVLPSTVTAYFVAVRSLDQETYASCAEFNLYEDPENPEPTSVLSYLDVNRDKFWINYKIDRSGWTATANSEKSPNNNDGPASYMIDGNTNTMWHSFYGTGGHNDRPSSSDPFIATINLGQETTFRAFTYMPRQVGDPNGRFRHYEFYVAQTQEQLTAKINNNEYLSRGDIDHTLALSTLVVFRTAQTGQFVALKSYDHDGYATCAEFDLYSDSPEMPCIYSKLVINEIADNTWTPYKINRSGWTASANSEKSPNNNDGPASYMIDGNTNTMWHSFYGTGGHNDRPSSSDPFIATINLGQETTFVAFSYMPRQAGDPNGKFKRYEFYAAQSQEELDTLINETKYTARGEINRSSTLSTLIMFEKPITARYVALISLDHTDNFATCAEFNLYNGIPSNPLPTPPPAPAQLSSKEIIDEATDTFWTSYTIDRSGWKPRANSEERTVHSNGDGPLSHMFDGNANTWWHSNYGTGHNDRYTNEKIHFSIDLGQETTFKAFSYRPRGAGSDTGTNGKFKHIEFYTADTSEELFIKIKNRNHITEHDIDDSLKISSFIIFKEQQTARHIAVMITEGVAGYATCAEFNLYSEPPPTPSASQSPTETPTESPTQSPTESPTQSATESPTQSATESPTESPTQSATESPTQSATESPTQSATESPTQSATESPTESATESPTESATESATESPTLSPTPSIDTILVAEATGNYAQANYINKYKIPNNKFTPSTNGDQINQSISNAFDNNDKTFWASSINTTETTKGYITVDFASTECIEAIIFGPAYSTNRTAQTRRYDGFPVVLKVYTSINDEPLKLNTIFSGQPEKTNLWHRVQYVFNEPIYANKIKLEFTEVTLDVSFGSQYTAACAELIFVAPIPPATLSPTPPPSRTPLPPHPSYDAGIIENIANGKNNNMQFDCPIQEGSIVIYSTCSGCNKLSEGQKVWFKVYFENGNIQKIEHEDILLHNNVYMTAFVPSNRIEYNTDSNILSYFLDSGTMFYNESEINLECFVPPMTRKATPTQSPTESPTQSATESATESPTESATQSPTPATATPTTSTATPATATPEMPTPTPFVDEIIFDESNFTENVDGRDRIEKEVTEEDENVAVVVKKSEFSGNTNNNGGAIHIVNCGLKTDGTIFRECKSNEGAGGAIFIENSHNSLSDVKFKNLKIIECSAEYGGGAYIYSKSKNNIVNIFNCIFQDNVATRPQSDNNLYGGSAMFLTVKKSIVKKCTFENNDVKIYHDFNSAATSRINSLEDASLLLTECKFKISKNMKYSLFYYGGNYATNIKLNSCTFYGQLNDGAYFIDGQMANKNSPKMIVKSCKFSSNSFKALNQNGQFASIDLKDQIFESDQFEESSGKKKNMKSIIIISVSVMALVIIIIVSLVIFIKKRINPNVYSNVNDGIEMSSQSTDISMNSLVTPLI